jgi:hypothetical protein
LVSVVDGEHVIVIGDGRPQLRFKNRSDLPLNSSVVGPNQPSWLGAITRVLHGSGGVQRASRLTIPL